MSDRETVKKSFFKTAFSMLDATFWRFIMVGVINTIVGTSTMFLLYNQAGYSYWFSSAGNYVAGGICSFFLNKFFTFKAYGKERSSFKNSIWQAIKFAATVFLSYVIAYYIAKKVIYWILPMYSIKVRDNVAMFCGMGGYVMMNYLLQRLWVFRKLKQKESAEKK